jgi:hypothetical protein
MWNNSTPSVLAPMSVDNIQLNLKRKINIKGSRMRGCSLLQDGRMVLSCYNDNTVSFMNTEGVELFHNGLWLVTVNTCRVFLLLSLFALRPNMFVDLMHTFLC